MYIRVAPLQCIYYNDSYCINTANVSANDLYNITKYYNKRCEIPSHVLTR